MYTCNGLMMQTKKSLTGIKGLSEAKVENISEAAEKIVIVSKDLSNPVRSHKDLDKDAAPFFKKAVQFYEEFAKQVVSQGHVLDVFASALDQVGVAEMKVAIERTGGLVVLAESFGHSVFKDSLKRIFEDRDKSLGLSFNGTLELTVQRMLKSKESLDLAHL